MNVRPWKPPEKAMSDGAQSLDPRGFEQMMRELAPYIELWKRSRESVTGSVNSQSAVF